MTSIPPVHGRALAAAPSPIRSYRWPSRPAEAPTPTAGIGPVRARPCFTRCWPAGLAVRGRRGRPARRWGSLRSGRCWCQCRPGVHGGRCRGGCGREAASWRTRIRPRRGSRPRGPPRGLYLGHTSYFHSSTACSSRSRSASRRLPWPAVPFQQPPHRRHRRQARPQPTADHRLDQATVQRSSSKPCADGPLPSPSSSTASWASVWAVL